MLVIEDVESHAVLADVIGSHPLKIDEKVSEPGVQMVVSHMFNSGRA